MNLPNILTLSRIVMIPVFVAIFYLPAQWSYVVSAAIFAIAGATDWLDGYLARKLDQSTPFGAFLDPVADKLMVAVALTVLIEEHASFILTVPAMVIIGREIVISALRSGWQRSVAVPVLRFPILARSRPPRRWYPSSCCLRFRPGTIAWFGTALLYLAAVLTLWSMVLYLQAAWPDLFPETEQRQ